MSILDRLLSVFGLGGTDDRRDRKPTVTVEHEPDASDEAAVKGVDAGADATTDAEGPDGDATDPAGTGSAASGDEASEADVGASDTDTDVGASGAGAEADAETAGAETAGAEGPDAETASAEADAEGPDAADTTTPAAAAKPVETVKGIGPAYAEQLEGAGVETLDDLGAADAADLAERTSLSEKRISRWIERARARLD